MSGTRFSFPEERRRHQPPRAPREQTIEAPSQRENKLPDTVVTKFLIESGRSRKCQFSGP